MLDVLFGTWSGILSLGILLVSIAIIGYLFYLLFFRQSKEK